MFCSEEFFTGVFGTGVVGTGVLPFGLSFFSTGFSDVGDVGVSFGSSVIFNSGNSKIGTGGINGMSLISSSGFSKVGASVGSSHVGSVLFSPIASPRPPTRATLKVDEAVVSSDVSVTLFVGLRLSLTGFFSLVL